MNQWVEIFHAASRAHILVTVNAYDLQERLIFDQIGEIAAGRHGRITARFRYQNTGNTAARISEISFVLTWGLDTVTPTYGRGLLAPGDGIWNTVADFESIKFPIHSNEMTPEQARQILAKNQTVWLFGRVVYSDVMGANHETQFCRRLNIDTQDFELGPAEFNLTP